MNNPIVWHNETNAAELAKTLAKNTAEKLSQLIQQYDTARLFVSGGKSPVAFFQALSRYPIDWKKVTVALVDERCVPHQHEDSNSTLVKQNLLINAATDAKWHDIVNDKGEPKNSLLFPNNYSIAVLGMGEDGHTASLFPDAINIQAALNLNNKEHYIIVQPNRAAHTRISLTAHAMIQFTHLFLLIQGDKKRIVLEQALSEANTTSPIGVVLKNATCRTDIYWSP